MKIKDVVFVLQHLIIFFIFVSSLIAQENTFRSRISGRVIDITTQQPLLGANVWLLNTKYGAATDNEGIYTINNIPVGRYSIVATMMGYKQVAKTDIVVVPKRTTIVNFELKLSPIEMSELVVKSGYFVKDSDGGITSSLSISHREVSKTPGAPDIFRRLQSVAGIVKASDQSPTLIVRGGSPDDLRHPSF